MKLVTYAASTGEARVGVQRDNAVIDIAAAAEARGIDLPKTVLGILEAGPAAIEHVRWLSEDANAATFQVSDPRLLAPIPRPPKVLGLAGNFVAHIIEGGEQPRPKEGATPDVFLMPSSSVIGP
ncbi:MAG: FAA hydrolase family protein, partial [Gemmatimonadaceae bacterium]